MDRKKWTLALTLVVAISILTAGYTALARYNQEKQHRQVSIALVYDEVVTLARMQGLEPVEALRKLHEAGAGTVLIKEPALKDAAANGEFLVRTGTELLLLDDAGVFNALGEDFRQHISDNYHYLFFKDESAYQRVRGQLAAKEVPAQTWNGDGWYVIGTGYHWALLEQVGVGIPETAVRDVRDAGMDVMVQLRTWNQVTPEGLEYVFRETGAIPGLTGIMFNDPRPPGMPDLVRNLAYAMDKTGVPLVQIEFFPQEGLSRLGVLLDKNVLRLHTISLEEDARRNFSLAAMVDRFTLAATERNIRVLLVHGYLKSSAPDALQMNVQLVENLRDRLVSEGMLVGSPSSLQPMAVSRGVLFVTGLGVIAGGILLAFVMGLRRFSLYLGLAGLLLWAALLAVDMVNPARKLMAFAAVVIFPTLALALTLRREGASPGRCVLLLVQTSLISLVGALLMVGLLADKGFMLKLDQFTGVKLAHVMPLLLVAAIFFFRAEGENGGGRRQLQRLMDQPILVKFALVAGVLLVALLIYVSRTGNEAVAISSLELRFRTLLDNLLGVRPRTKEFLLGHPLLLLLFYLGFRDNRYQPLLLAGAIGQISLVNTYAHIHTPLLVSLLRSFNGLWLGILGGLLLMAAWQLGTRLAARYFPPDEG